MYQVVGDISLERRKMQIRTKLAIDKIDSSDARQLFTKVMEDYSNGKPMPNFDNIELKKLSFYLAVIELSSYIGTEKGAYDYKAQRKLNNLLAYGGYLLVNPNYHIGLYKIKKAEEIEDESLS